jgi:hypothetical protein
LARFWTGINSSPDIGVKTAGKGLAKINLMVIIKKSSHGSARFTGGAPGLQIRCIVERRWVGSIPMHFRHILMILIRKKPTQKTAIQSLDKKII